MCSFNEQAIWVLFPYRTHPIHSRALELGSWQVMSQAEGLAKVSWVIDCQNPEH